MPRLLGARFVFAEFRFNSCPARRSVMKRTKTIFLSIVTIGLLCLLAFVSRSDSAGQRRRDAEPLKGPNFDFQRFTKGQSFRLNTLPTTIYGPPWADVIVQGSNMVECQ